MTGRRKTIVCFGDSNTWGYDAKTDARFDEETRWTGRLARLLGDGYRVVEEGLSGRTSVCEDPLFEGLRGLDYIYPCLLSHSPIDLVVIMLGTNDTKERFGLTSFNIAQGITRLSNKAKGTPAGNGGVAPDVLVVAPPVIGKAYADTPIGAPMGARCDEKSFELPVHLEALLKETGIRFADSNEAAAMGETDHMHLDAEGHGKMAEFMHKHISRIFN
ncbi:SGNH/GDSL hydrolase family protein [Cohnella faecalis]|uniref:Lipolytic enzyme, G-D-S-L n=1 Tax=Cohnella faecalis TaxID=2315694 RepID=A0A398CT88_9BACL|nr:SGNH/GDSL hydrolase family protein [Cohnella faecalis]RIE03978.1 lipolytic enzyme, G-D-S-L [Cohnella faecalis]